MAWSKGAVVIVKRGDPEMGDTIENGLNIQKTTGGSGKYCFMPRRHTKEELAEMMEDADALYGRRWIPPTWLRKINEGIAFVVYHVCMFIEKYLKI